MIDMGLCHTFGGHTKVIATGNKFNVAFNVESVLTVFDKKKCVVEKYYQCEACRTEHVFGPHPLFRHPSVYFTPVFGRNSGVVFRNKSREVVKDDTLLNGYRVYPVMNDRMMKKPFTQVAELVMSRRCKVTARTKFDLGNGSYAVAEYPVRTLNISRQRDLVQVDTGPVIVPVKREFDHIVDSLRLAFVAFFEKDKASLVVDEPRDCCEKAAIECVDFCVRETFQVENELYCEVA